MFSTRLVAGESRAVPPWRDSFMARKEHHGDTEVTEKTPGSKFSRYGPLRYKDELI